MSNDQPWNHRPTMAEFAGDTTPVVVETPAQLEEAVKQQADTIVIEGGLASDTTRIVATGKLSWAVAIGTICVNLAKVILGAKGASQPTFTGNAKGKYLVEKGGDGRIVLKRQ